MYTIHKSCFLSFQGNLEIAKVQYSTYLAKEKVKTMASDMQRIKKTALSLILAMWWSR